MVVPKNGTQTASLPKDKSLENEKELQVQQMEPMARRKHEGPRLPSLAVFKLWIATLKFTLNTSISRRVINYMNSVISTPSSTILAKGGVISSSVANLSASALSNSKRGHPESTPLDNRK